MDNIKETGGFTLNPIEDSVEPEDLEQSKSLEINFVKSFQEKLKADDLLEAKNLLNQEKNKSPENIEIIDTIERELFRAYRARAKVNDSQEDWASAKKIAEEKNCIKGSTSSSGREAKLKKELEQYSQYKYEDL